MPKFDIAPEALKETILSRLEVEINEIADRHIKKCMEAIESDVRASLGNVALRMIKDYDIRNMGDRITIEVRNGYSTLR